MISGDLEPANVDLRFCVRRSQRSHASCRSVQEKPSFTEGHDNNCSIAQNTQEASDAGLRTYLKRSMQVLRSHMDVQVVKSKNDAAEYISKVGSYVAKDHGLVQSMVKNSLSPWVTAKLVLELRRSWEPERYLFVLGHQHFLVLHIVSTSSIQIQRLAGWTDVSVRRRIVTCGRTSNTKVFGRCGN